MKHRSIIRTYRMRPALLFLGIVGPVTVVGQGDAADDEENGERNAAGFHAVPLA
jgi:hypothetical protein